MLITTQADSRTAYGKGYFDWDHSTARIKGVANLYFSDRGGRSGPLFPSTEIDEIEFEITQPGASDYRIDMLNKRWGNRTVVTLQESNPHRLLTGWGSTIGNAPGQALYVFSIVGRYLN
jgi:hypothetical protein